MFEHSPQPRVFALPCGVDFAQSFAHGLLARMKDHPPEDLARVTIYVNAARMRLRIRTALSAQGALLLPRIRVVTELDKDHPLLHIPRPIPALRRKLELNVLIAHLLETLPDLAPKAAAADLSDSLYNLIAEMQGEGVTPARIAALDVGDFSAHWARTQRFLSLIGAFFTTEAQPGHEGYQRRIAEALLQIWQANPPQDPVIVAGSTGSRGASGLLMRAVAGLPQGALVLPGFDTHMPGAVWTRLDDALSAEDHPQYRFRKLMREIGSAPQDVQAWSNIAPPCPERNRVISLALRPAPVTDQWMIEGQNLPPLDQAMRGVTLIEAESPRHEALAIAVALRHAAEEKRSAALITPDRTLARQVTAALARWNILPDDSGGLQPLQQTAPGRFLRHVLRLPCQRMTADQLLVLLKHPLTASDPQTRGTHLLLTRELELHLRKHGPAFPTGADIITFAAKQNNTEAAQWAEALDHILTRISDPDAAEMPFAAHLETLIAQSEALARGWNTPQGTSGALWHNTSGETARAFITALRQEAAHGGAMTAHAFRDLFDSLISRETLREIVQVHPYIRIWGTIEARSGGADLLILGGLNEGSWPAMPPHDPWLNRKMRLDAGLLLPERRIGLSAHDFEQAIAVKDVILTRAKRSSDAETIPARWLNRLCNLLGGLPAQGGETALTDMRARGSVWLDLAGGLDRPITPAPKGLSPAKRPAPAPPVSARPRRLSLTAIERLIRDPYAIYAENVLKLRAIPPLRPVADARVRGTVIHEILELFVKDRPDNESLDDAKARFLHIGAQVLDAQIPWPATRLLWQERVNRICNHFIAKDQELEGQSIALEERGTLHFPEIDFHLFGIPDRIDVLPDGALHLIDYKTGTPPTEKQTRQFQKQLHLAAVIAEAGGFRALGPTPVARITYIGLGGDGKDLSIELTQDSIARERAGFASLIAHYQSAQVGYPSRRAVFDVKFPGQYDHLARFGEWEMTDAPMIDILDTKT